MAGRHFQLPFMRFDIDNIICIEDDEEADEICEDIQNRGNYDILGFDVEYSSYVNKPALIQLCPNDSEAYLFRICKFGVPDELRNILMDDRIFKVGIGIKKDYTELQDQYKSMPGWKHLLGKSIIELSDLANERGYRRKDGRTDLIWALNEMVEVVLKKQIPTVGYIMEDNGDRYPPNESRNWANKKLREEEREYAALHAYAPYLLYEKLNTMTETSQSWCSIV